jgi:amino acid permease
MDFVQILASDCGGLQPVISLIKNIFNLIKILVPIVLILMGAIDLTKAVMASDDKEIKAATSKLIKRAIAAVAVFFAVTLVDVIMGLVGDSGAEDGDDAMSWSQCWKNA